VERFDVTNRPSLTMGRIGEDSGTPISEEYKVPFVFTGTIAKVTIELGGADAKVAAEVERQRQMARTAE
jgi:arylsulfatase